MSSTSVAASPLESTVPVELLRAHPAVLVAAALIVHALLWTLTAWIADPTPQPRLALALALGREWQLGYLDAPPLAPWILEIAWQLGGLFAVYALGPISVALAGWLVFRFGRRIVGERHAAIATFLMVGLYPVAFPAGAFDADLVQMPLVALAVLVWWRAVHDRSKRAWIFLGVVMAALTYAGVQGMFVLTTLMLITVATEQGRSIFYSNDARIAAVAGLLLFTLLLTPRLIWLSHHGFAGGVLVPSTEYEVAARTNVFGLVAAVVFGHLVLLVLVVIGSPLMVKDREAAPEFVRAPLEKFARWTVYAVATLPVLFALVAAAFAEMRFPPAAAAPLLLYSGLLVVVIAGDTFRIQRLRIAAFAALSLLVLPPVLEAASALAAPWVSSDGRPTNWPAGSVARYITDVYRTRAGKPLEIVVGDARTASAVALASADRPRVFLDADPAQAPWLSREDVAEKGAVVLWPINGANASPPASLVLRLPSFVPEAPLTLEWVRTGRLDVFRLGWAIIPPAKK